MFVTRSRNRICQGAILRLRVERHLDLSTSPHLGALVERPQCSTCWWPCGAPDAGTTLRFKLLGSDAAKAGKGYVHRDLRVVAKRRVPRMFYDYVDSGSWTEATYRANEDDFKSIKLRQRVARNLEHRSIRTTMVGLDVSMPVAIAPTGLTGMQHADGEILAARASEAFGIPYTLSTMSICSIEDVAANTTKPFWFQLYVMRDRDFVGRLIDRAKAAKCSALVLTLDLQIIGQRHKDIQNGLSTRPKLTLNTLLNLAAKPRWCWQMLRTRRHQFGNVVGHVDGVQDMSSLLSWTEQHFDPSLSWGDVAWIKERWGSKLVLKGILDLEDARLAVASGADALVVSNHGGPQLDGAPSAISGPAGDRGRGGQPNRSLAG
jgi:L-lactate dehydrogenase (cytochrome)